MRTPIHGDLTAGVARTTDRGGLAPALIEAIEDAGGLWHAGDYYAAPATIVSTARANGVRALRVDARDLAFLRELPELQFLHLRSDGRPPLEPISALPNLRALVIETGALRGTVDLRSHPRLEWLKIKLSGKGGAANVDSVLAGHLRVRDLRLSEIPFSDLTDVAGAFPSVRFLRVWGADRLRLLGDLSPWRDTLEGIDTTFMPLRSLDGIEAVERLRFLGLTASKIKSLAPLDGLQQLRYLSVLGHVPPLNALRAHGIRIARLSMPEDGDLAPLTTWPQLTGLIGKRWTAPGPGVPFLEDLPADHELVREWRDAKQTSEGLLML